MFVFQEIGHFFLDVGGWVDGVLMIISVLLNFDVIWQRSSFGPEFGLNGLKKVPSRKST